MSNTTLRQPALYLPHGGGPCFFLDPAWRKKPGEFPREWAPMGEYLSGVGGSLDERPRAVLVLSAHWERPVATVNEAARYQLLYDYYGFPPHTYTLEYPASGAPEVAARVRELLAGAGVANEGESARGLDHGVFVPLMLVLPEADVPVVQLSLLRSLDAGEHLALGRAIAPLRDEGVLIVGSGMSYHNLREFFVTSPQSEWAAEAFDDWLTATVEAPAAERDARLAEWEQAPYARAAHPREEHLLPLMVAAGAAGAETGVRTFHDRVMGKAVSAYRFG
jgi:aromatic ring-opening dioxygenase catalytic subunit (LigB family)